METPHNTDTNNWLIQHCATQGCETAIRVPAHRSLAFPLCKWCAEQKSHATNGKDWPDGMPDPSLPWPWMTDKEREKKLALPYWQARFRRHPKYYQQFILKQTQQPTEVIEAEA